MAHDVFISHSIKDKTTADAVCAMLESNGARCWIAPRDVTPGREWGECIIEAIKECRIMVLVFTTHANESSQIRREVERAVNHGAVILPLRVEDVIPGTALEYFIGNVHWLDALTPPLEDHLRSLAGTVKMLLARIPPRDAAQPAAPIQPAVAAPPKSAVADSAQSSMAKPLAPPAEKRALPSAWIYGGAGAVLAIAIAFAAVVGWLFWQEKPTKQVTVQPAPAVEVTPGPFPNSPKPAPVDMVPRNSPSAARPEGNPTTRVSPEVPSNLPAKPIPNGSSAILPEPVDAVGFRNQGLYYRDKVQDLDRAILDFNQAIRLQPNYSDAFANRGDAYLWKGDFSRAAEDYNEVIRLSPGSPEAFHRRGVIRLLLGQFRPAQDDFRQALASNQTYPDRVYDPIWLYLAETKNGQNARADLATYAGRLNLTNWPGPAISLFLGTAAPDAVVMAAKDPNSATNARQQCQAYYFGGEYFSFSGRRANAAQFFQQSVATGQTRQFAYIAAKSELDRLQK